MHIAPRRGLSREDAAGYVGVGTTKFDELVAAGSPMFYDINRL
jgi:hypothetical protein